MVNFHNSIEKEEDDLNSIPVYPFKVDVAVFPERKYLAGIYHIAKYLYISLLLIALISPFIIFKAFSKKTSPVFIYWDKLNSKFDYVKKDYNFPIKQEELFETKPEDIYLTEYFLYTYLQKRFSISLKKEINNKVWCNCEDKRKLKNIFTPDDCYICKYAPIVYEEFKKESVAFYKPLEKAKITRKISILDTELKYYKVDEIKTTLLDKLLKKRYDTKIYSLYKVIFLITDFKNEKPISEESFIGFISIKGIKGIPEKKEITAESYMFHPYTASNLKKIYKGSNEE